jgi:hypothetical protein
MTPFRKVDDLAAVIRAAERLLQDCLTASLLTARLSLIKTMKKRPYLQVFEIRNFKCLKMLKTLKSLILNYA